MEKKEVRTRFAPSPTGFMHIGNLRSALYGYLFVKKHNGQMILRIEDTDVERYVKGAVEVIYKTCDEAGVIFDEGPREGGPYGPYVQSERKPIYLEHAKKLVEQGDAYYCFCDKERLETVTFMGTKRYDKHCLSLSKEEVQRRLDAGESYVIRQNIPIEGESSYTDLVFGEITVPNKDMEDNILIKSDGMPTYNFAHVVDDHLMHVTYVIRGNEYLSSTPKYNLPYQYLFSATVWFRVLLHPRCHDTCSFSAGTGPVSLRQRSGGVVSRGVPVPGARRLYNARTSILPGCHLCGPHKVHRAG